MYDIAMTNVQLPPHAAAVTGIPALSIRGFESDQSVFGVARTTGQYEPYVMDVIADKLPVGGVFVDVGANIGILSVLAAARAGAEGRVLAVEASPLNHGLLAMNLEQAGFCRFQTLNRGAWDRQTTLTITHIPQGPGWSFVSPEASDEGISFLILCEPLDVLMAKSGVAHVDLLKVDVEGAEVRVLRGAKHLLEGRHPGIILEINPDTLRKFGTSPLELYDSVREYGYGMQVIAREGGLVPVTSYADLDGWFMAGHAYVDVLCE